MPPVVPDKLPCESVQQLEQEISTLRDALSLEETEETWDRIARALTRFSAVVKGGGYKYEKELVNGIKASAKPIVSAMNSERTRLSAAALECLTIIAPRVGLAFEGLVSLFVPHILRLATRTNKVYVTRSQTGSALIISYCHIPSIIPYLLAACKESKIITGRAIALEGVLRCLNKWDWTQREIKAKVGDVEEVVRITARDKDAGIRQTSRKVFEAYKVLFPDRIDEFTGPLTPVMRKYLDVKPQNTPSKAIERAQSPSALSRTKRQAPLKLDFTKSTSAVPDAAPPNVRASTKTHGRSASSSTILAAGAMPPPALIPSQGSVASRPQPRHLTPDNPQSEKQTDFERQRVLSTASSTFSIKSVPSNPHHAYQHRPPVRLAASQSHATMTIAASSAPARRVPRVVAVEPHPANRPDISKVVPKTPMRPTPVSLQLQNLPGASGKDPVGVAQDAPPSATGVVFPTSEPETAVERKGPRRVPKPVAPPPKADRPETVMSDNVKREVKPSIFRRGVPGAKRDEKPKESYAPRRGGGVTQATLSQLSKQRAPLSSSENGRAALVRNRPTSTSASKRPAWGAGTKPATSKGLLGSRVASRNGIAKVPVAKQNNPVRVIEVQPAMVSLSESPAAADNGAVALAVPLSGSPKAPQLCEEEMQEATASDEVTTEETSEAVQGLTGSETNFDQVRIDKAQEVLLVPSDEDGQDVFTSETSPPRTPPFPSAEEETDEDELDAIEFTTGDAYDSTGVPIKTPGKAVKAAAGVPPVRNPLAEVILNE